MLWNLLSFLLRCGTRPYERGTQWDSNSPSDALHDFFYRSKPICTIKIPVNIHFIVRHLTVVSSAPIITGTTVTYILDIFSVFQQDPFVSIFLLADIFFFFFFITFFCPKRWSNSQMREIEGGDMQVDQNKNAQCNTCWPIGDLSWD